MTILIILLFLATFLAGAVFGFVITMADYERKICGGDEYFCRHDRETLAKYGHNWSGLNKVKSKMTATKGEPEREEGENNNDKWENNKPTCPRCGQIYDYLTNHDFHPFNCHLIIKKQRKELEYPVSAKRFIDIVGKKEFYWLPPVKKQRKVLGV
jgi:hypothetical protein